MDTREVMGRDIVVGDHIAWFGKAERIVEIQPYDGAMTSFGLTGRVAICAGGEEFTLFDDSTTTVTLPRPDGAR